MTLSILIWLPAAVGVLAALLPRRLTAWTAFAGSAATLGIAVSFVARFHNSSSGLQFLTDQTWISQLGIHYKLGLDGLNVALVLLTTILFSAAIAWAAFHEWERPRLFFFWMVLAESAVLGAFCAQDLALFVGFFDLMLIPFYFLIGMWGSGQRVRATIKLVIYTLVGSFFMLAGAVATGAIASSEHHTGLTFVLSSLQHLPLSHHAQNWIFLCFALAFVVKMPLVPFHGWLADGYKAMPIPAIAVFSAILSKVAAYGFLRVVLPLFPYASVHYQLLMLIIALASIFWATSLAFTAPDARLVVAYSSVAQLGFITLGIFSLRGQGAQGALLQMVNHGLVTAPAFFIVAALAARSGGSELLRDMGGIAFRAPVLASMFLIVALATLAMPGSSNFIGEFLILLGVFHSKLAISIIAFAGVVGASVYALRLFIRSMHNRVNLHVRSFDVDVPDIVGIAPIVLVILALAFFPQFVLTRTQSTVKSDVAAVTRQSGGGTGSRQTVASARQTVISSGQTVASGGRAHTRAGTTRYASTPSSP